MTSELPSFPPPTGAPAYPPAGVAPSPLMRARRPRRGRFAALVLSGALLVGGGAGVAGAAVYGALDDPSSTGNASAGAALQVVDSGDSAAPSGSVESVAAAVLPSVVALQVSGGQGASGSGSGVVLDANGLILTNDHVVTLGGQIDSGQAEITASFSDGTRAKATVVGTDPLTDTALVRVSGVSGLKPVTVGKSGNLDVGEQVVAIGSPYGLDSTVTSGIVSALDRPVEVAQDEQGRATAYPAIQTDAAINPGNSGGALVNMEGQLVGINASIRTAGSAMSGEESGSIGLGFAIPVDAVLPIVEQLRAGDTPTHARLGVQISDAADGGAQIGKLDADSAAASAGLEEGDVITSIDDHRVADSTALVATVRAYRPGQAVTITYLRDGKQGTTRLELGSDA